MKALVIAMLLFGSFTHALALVEKEITTSTSIPPHDGEDE